jgi:hypothetical protein
VILFLWPRRGQGLVAGGARVAAQATLSPRKASQFFWSPERGEGRNSGAMLVRRRKSSIAPSGLRTILETFHRGLRVAYGASCAPGYKTIAPSGRHPGFNPLSLARYVEWKAAFRFS